MFFTKRWPVVLAGIAMVMYLCDCSGKKDAPTPSPGEGKLIADKNWQFDATPFFADEFNTAGKPDAAKWAYDTGGDGWGNNELEYYTDGANATVASGSLTITAKKETPGSSGYTSARMVSSGDGSLKYGRVEVRAKLPAGTGTWPAIWMLPDDDVYGNWPNSGEIDIMEMVGYDPTNIYFTVHNALFNGANGKGADKTVTSATTAFHVYRVDWTPFAIRGYYDGGLMFTYQHTSQDYKGWPYDQNFHLLLNIAVGGSWGGQKGIDGSVFPASMQIDYVRFYKMIEK